MFDQGDPAGLPEDELSSALLEVTAAIDRAQAKRLAIAAEWDRRQAWALDGAGNGRCWLTHRGGLSRSEAGAVIRTAQVVASAPLVAEAVADGSLPVAKAHAFPSEEPTGR